MIKPSKWINIPVIVPTLEGVATAGTRGMRQYHDNDPGLGNATNTITKHIPLQINGRLFRLKLYGSTLT